MFEGDICNCVCNALLPYNSSFTLVRIDFWPLLKLQN